MKLTTEALETIVQEGRKATKWASYRDLKEVRDDILEDALDSAGEFCYDAVNLVFSRSSSTSGMYASWQVEISLECTMYLDRWRDSPVKPVGLGGDLNVALAVFTLRCRQATEARMKRENEPS